MSFFSVHGGANAGVNHRCVASWALRLTVFRGSTGDALSG
jgi:hypothetical protein